MGLFKKIFALPHINEGINLDDPGTTLLHRDIILQKKLVKKIYIDWYSQITKRLENIPEGRVVEIGSGGGFFKDIYPQVITSDIMPLSWCDMMFSAEKMPFEDSSISAFVMVNVFHHIPDCEAFLQEAQRVLKDGGKIIMVEPGNCGWSRFIYKNFHSEPFDEKSNSWKISDSSGPLSGANGAIPWIVTQRDKNLFEKKFSSLEIQKGFYHGPLLYLLSGGVSLKSLIPTFSYGFLRWVEKILEGKYFHMFCTTEIIKRGGM